MENKNKNDLKFYDDLELFYKLMDLKQDNIALNIKVIELKMEIRKLKGI